MKTEKHIIPWAVEKALTDRDWQYLVILKNGVIIEFAGAHWAEADGFVILDGAKIVYPKPEQIQLSASYGHQFDRGMSVRISEIACAVDAPYSS